MSNNFKYWLFTFSLNGIVKDQKIITNHKDFNHEISRNSGCDLVIRLVYSD